MSTTIPDFHDGYLTGVQVADSQADLFLKQVNGEAWQLTLAGLQALQMDDFRQGNIIYSVEAISGINADREVLERLFPGPHPSAAQEYHDTHAQVIAGKAAMVVAGEATVLIVLPSYGAELVGFGTSLTITPLHGDGS